MKAAFHFRYQIQEIHPLSRNLRHVLEAVNDEFGSEHPVKLRTGTHFLEKHALE